MASSSESCWPAGGWLTTSCSRTQVKSWGMKMALKPGGEGGVYVGAGAVADHPGVAGFAAVMGGEGEIGFVMFFGKTSTALKCGGEAGAVKLVGLLVRDLPW